MNAEQRTPEQLERRRRMAERLERDRPLETRGPATAAPTTTPVED